MATHRRALPGSLFGERNQKHWQRISSCLIAMRTYVRIVGVGTSHAGPSPVPARRGKAARILSPVRGLANAQRELAATGSSSSSRAAATHHCSRGHRPPPRPVSCAVSPMPSKSRQRGAMTRRSVSRRPIYTFKRGDDKIEGQLKQGDGIHSRCNFNLEGAEAVETR